MNGRDKEPGTIRNTVKATLLALPGFEKMCRVLTKRHVRVLMYHRFTRDPMRDPRHMPLAVLERHLDYLSQHFDVLCPDEQLDREKGGGNGATRPGVVITVDDGYRDFYEMAYPALRQRAMKATLFVTTSFVDGRTWMWWDKVSYMLANTQATVINYDLGPVYAQGRTGTVAERSALWAAIASPLRFVPDASKELAIRKLGEATGVAVPPKPPAEYAAVDWQALSEMAGSIITVGAHTVHHPILSRVCLERARAEIVDSRTELATRGIPILSVFAYPQGGPADFTAGISELVREAGFRGAYVAYCAPGRADRFAMSRYNVPRDFVDFRWLCCGAEFLSRKVRSILRLSTGVSEEYWQGHKGPR